MSYREMGERGRETALARTKGRHKVLVDRVVAREVRVEVWVPAVGPFAAHWGPDPSGLSQTYVDLYGACGHVLTTRMVRGPADVVAAQDRVGRRMTCPHEDCRIPTAGPGREPREDDCAWWVGKDEATERRCRIRAVWDTGLGQMCTQHRDYLLRNGYLTDAGTRLPR